jgi:hypothetical protein
MMDHIKGISGLAGIWSAWFFGHIEHISQAVEIFSFLCAAFASLSYSVYFIRKAFASREK